MLLLFSKTTGVCSYVREMLPSIWAELPLREKLAPLRQYLLGENCWPELSLVRTSISSAGTCSSFLLTEKARWGPFHFWIRLSGVILCSSTYFSGRASADDLILYSSSKALPVRSWTEINTSVLLDFHIFKSKNQVKDQGGDSFFLRNGNNLGNQKRK